MADLSALLGTVSREDQFKPDAEQENLHETMLEETARRQANERRGEEAERIAQSALGKIKKTLEAGDRSDQALSQLLIHAVEALEAIAGNEKAKKAADKSISLLQEWALLADPVNVEREIMRIQSELERMKASREMEDPERLKQLDWAIRAKERRLEALLHSLPAVKKIVIGMAKTDNTAPILCRIEKKKGVKSEFIKVTVID